MSTIDPRLPPLTDEEIADVLRDHVPEFIPVPSADSDLSRIRHALCIALDYPEDMGHPPTYDMLLRLLSSGWRAQKVVTSEPGVSTWPYRGFQTSGVVEPVTVTFNERPHDPALIALLRHAEWAGTEVVAFCGYSTCPWCNAREMHGHLPTCPVAPILYPKEQA